MKLILKDSFQFALAKILALKLYNNIFPNFTQFSFKALKRKKCLMLKNKFLHCSKILLENLKTYLIKLN